MARSAESMERSAQRKRNSRAPSSEWYNELAEGRREAFTGRGSTVAANYQRMLDEFARLDRERTPVEARDTGGGLGVGSVLAGGLAIAAGAGERAQSGYEKTISLLDRLGAGNRNLVQGKGVGAAVEGLKGNKPSTFADFLKEELDPSPDRDGAIENILAGAAGLGLDIVTDPLTYLGGVGVVRRGAQVAGKVDDIVRGESVAKDTVEAAADEAAGLSPRSAPLTGSKIETGSRAPVQVQTVSRSVSSPTDVSGIADLLNRVEQKTGFKMAQTVIPNNVHLRPARYTANTRKTQTAPTIQVAPVQTPASVVAKPVAKKSKKTPKNPDAAKLQQMVQEITEGKYVSPHFDRSKPLGNDGLPLLTKEKTQEIFKQAEDELKSGHVGKALSPEQAAKVVWEREVAAKNEDAMNFTWREIKEDPALLEYYQRLAREQGNYTGVSKEQIRGRAREIAAKFKQAEIAKENAVPRPAAVSGSAADTPAVAKSEEAAQKTFEARKATARDLNPDEIAVVQKVTAEYSRLVGQNAPVGAGKNAPRYAFNPAKQRNLYEKIQREIYATVKGGRKTVGNSSEWRNRIIAAYRVAEDDVAKATGKAPGDYVGNPLRLSDVLELIPPGTLIDDKLLGEVLEAMKKTPKGVSPEIQAIVNKARADAAIASVEDVSETVAKVEDIAAEAVAKMPEAQADIAIAKLPAAAKEEAVAKGVAPTIAEAVEQAAKDAIARKFPPTTVAIQVDRALPVINAKTYRYGKPTINEAEREFTAVHNIFERQRAYLGFKGRRWQKVPLQKQQDVIKDMMAKRPEIQKAGQVWGRIFMTTYQMSHAQPVLRQYEAGAETLARARVQQLQQLFKGPLADPETQEIAWKSLAPGAARTPEGEQIREVLRGWFGSKESFLYNNGMDMYDLNYMFNRLPGFKFQLSDKFTDALGKTWKESDFEDRFDFFVAQVTGSKDWPLTAHRHKSPVAGNMYDIMMASEKLAAEVWATRHLGDLFGTTRKVEGWQPLITKTGEPHPAFRNKTVYFPPEIAKEWTKYEDLVSSFVQSNAVAQKFDEAMSLWKSGVLNYSPAYHSRNMVGDVFLSFLAGVTNPNRYRQAIQLMTQAGRVRSQAGYFEPIEDLSTVAASGAGFTLKTKSGVVVNADQLILGFEKYGGAQNIAITENLGTNLEGKRTLTRPFGGKVQRATRKVSDIREDYGRLAHFIDAVYRTPGKNLDDVMRTAMQEVRKFHFDYGDLTQTEIRVMRRIAPFYTWIRKSTPLLLSNLAEQPWKMAVVPKTNYAIAEMLGQDPQSFSNPFPVGTEDQFPGWVHDTAAVPWFQKENGNYVTGMIEDPFSGNLTDFDNPREGVLGMMNPFAKLFIETAVTASDNNPNGVRLNTGVPITDRSTYIDQNIPITSQIGRLTNTSPVAGALESLVGNPDPGRGFTKTTDPNDPGGAGGFNPVAFMNFLTGLGLQENTAQRQLSAAYEAQKRMRDGSR